MTRLILTAVGPDRPGIVAGVTGVLFRAGANLQDTSMCILSGHFASLLVFQVPDTTSTASLEAEFQTLASELGIFVRVDPFVEIRKPAPPPGQEPDEEAYLITVMGADRPGIVHRVSTLLAEHRCNITDLNTRLLDQGGKAVYVMMLEVTPQEEGGRERLEKELGRLQKELDVEIRLRPLDPATL